MAFLLIGGPQRIQQTNKDRVIRVIGIFGCLGFEQSGSTAKASASFPVAKHTGQCASFLSGQTRYVGFKGLSSLADGSYLWRTEPEQNSGILPIICRPSPTLQHLPLIVQPSVCLSSRCRICRAKRKERSQRSRSPRRAFQAPRNQLFKERRVNRHVESKSPQAKPIVTSAIQPQPNVNCVSFEKHVKKWPYI